MVVIETAQQKKWKIKKRGKEEKGKTMSKQPHKSMTLEWRGLREY